MGAPRTCRSIRGRGEDVLPGSSRAVGAGIIQSPCGASIPASPEAPAPHAASPSPLFPPNPILGKNPQFLALFLQAVPAETPPLPLQDAEVAAGFN